LFDALNRDDCAIAIAQLGVRARFVDEVDCLVGKLAIVEVLGCKTNASF
jgi:hypothetical protein